MSESLSTSLDLTKSTEAKVETVQEGQKPETTMIAIPSIINEAVGPTKGPGPAGKDFLDQSDLLGQDSERPRSTSPQRVLSEGGTAKPHRRMRSFSPIRRNPYAPQADGQKQFRRCQTTESKSRSQSPCRTTSNNVVLDTTLQLLEMVGIPVEEETTPADDEDNFDDYKVSESEIQTLVNDHDEFLRLKTALKAKGAVTNEMLRQRLHVYVHKNRTRLQSSSHHSAVPVPRESDCASSAPRESDCSAPRNSDWSAQSSASNLSFWFGMSG